MSDFFADLRRRRFFTIDTLIFRSRRLPFADTPAWSRHYYATPEARY